MITRVENLNTKASRTSSHYVKAHKSIVEKR